MEPVNGENDKKLERHWYAVATFSGYENKVKSTLEDKIRNQEGLSDTLFRVVIPQVEEVEEGKDGRKKIIKRKLLPGYVLVDMIRTDSTWYFVRNTNGVTGFLGLGKEEVPLTDEEVDSLRKYFGDEEPENAEKTASKAVMPIDVELGQLVKIKNGPFENVEGPVTFIDAEKGRLKVLVDAFGREVETEVEFSQIEKV